MVATDYKVSKGQIVDEYSRLDDAMQLYRLTGNGSQDRIVDRLYDFISLLKDAGWAVDMIQDIWER